MKRILLIVGIILSIFVIVIACMPEDGVDGMDGADGSNGINCWDLNSNGINDLNEDINKDGIFDTLDCRGEDGYSVVTKVSEAPTCEEGGYTITFGLDENRDQILNDSEPILHSIIVCNNPSGLSTLFETIPILEEDMNRCPGGNGGWEIWSGIDTNRNSKLEETERESSFIVCNGADGEVGRLLLFVIEETENGYIVKLGYDTNSDGTLSENEVVDTITLSNGDDGVNLSTPLVELEIIGVSDTCPAGGTYIFVGFDDDGDGSLSSSEITETSEICNGTPGTDGVDGTDGTNGTNGQNAVSFFVPRIITNNNGCNGSGPDGPGGVTVEVYDDVDGDGLLNRDIDFFLKEYSICYGMSVGQALSIGYELDDYFDIDVNITDGNDQCPDAPNASNVIVILEGTELSRFNICPAP